MHIFIDIGHPAHVHYFKNLIKIMKKEHKASFTVTSRNKEMAHSLLKSNDIPFVDRGKGKDGIIGKLLYLVKADFQIFRIARRKKPTLFLSFGSPYLSQVSFLMGLPSITIDDTESASLGQMFYKPFSKLILSPTTFYKDFGKKHVKFNSYMELSYLHPNYFNPDESIHKDLGLEKGEVYSILRFVKWKALHDLGHNGISNTNKILIVQELLKYGKVFISSEGELPVEIEKYRIKIAHEKIHSVLYFAKLFYGESATMASESAVLGTPAIYLDNNGRGYTDEQESKYGIVSNFNESTDGQEKSIKRANEIMNAYNQSEWDSKRERLLNDKIDVTKFLIETITKNET